MNEAQAFEWLMNLADDYLDDVFARPDCKRLSEGCAVHWTDGCIGWFICPGCGADKTCECECHVIRPLEPEEKE